MLVVCISLSFDLRFLRSSKSHAVGGVGLSDHGSSGLRQDNTVLGEVRRFPLRYRRLRFDQQRPSRWSLESKRIGCETQPGNTASVLSPEECDIGQGLLEDTH